MAGDGAELVDLLEARGRVDRVEELGAGATPVAFQLRRELRGDLLAEQPTTAGEGSWNGRGTTCGEELELKSL